MSEQLIQAPCAFGDNGNFLLERELGSGGMGGVYMGRDKMLDRPVAVKVMLKELGADPEFLEKFKKEAQSAAKLIHPNIAQIYSYGVCDGMPYMAMELAAGGSLYSIMNANPGKTDVARVIKICQQVAQALQCASDQGFVHCDVKPENILLDANGNAKLVDFGLAGMQKDTDEIWGTPYYISPEKVKKEPVDFRADIYSLGGTLYHALTGVAPFEGADSIEVIKKRFLGLPKKPSELRPELTPAIDDLVMKMLSFNKEDRYPSFEALLEAFKDVLTTGLSAAAAEPATAKPAASGAKRMAVRRRRVMMTKRPTAAAKVPAAESDPEIANQKDDEEGGGSLGAKVAAAVIGGIVLIGAVIGGLVWYTISSNNAEKARIQADIASGIGKARSAISDTMSGAVKFADDFDDFAARAIEECQKPTDELAKILPAEQGAKLKPGPSQELLAAIALTNGTSKAEASATNALAAAAGEIGAALGKAVGQMAEKMAEAMKEAAKMPKFRDPTEEEMDPASPEGEAYQKARKAFMEEQAKLLQEKLSKPNKTEVKPAVSEAERNSDDPAPQAVIAMNELWERAYSCQASAIRIRLEVQKLLAKGGEAELLKAETKENMDKLGELSRTLVDMLNQIKGSKDVENVSKGITFIKSKGKNTVRQTVKDLRLKKLREEREAARIAAEEAEKERLARLAAEKKAKIEEETASAKAKFDAIAVQGCFRQLDWKSALRQLEVAKAEATTAEGQLAFDREIRKVNDMKKVQDIFIKNLEGHVFKGKLNKCRVLAVNETEMTLLKGDGKTKAKITWQKFYKDYPGNFNEIINAYIFNARNTSARVKLTLSEWADAMTGAALTMKLVCAEVNGAIERSEKLMQETVKGFPEYLKTAQEIFPDLKFENVEE